MRQQCVAGDVERHTEEHVAAALSHDDRQHAVRHVELEHVVAWFQRHLGKLVGPPGGHDDATRVGVAYERVHHLGDLVHFTAVLVLPVSPLDTVDRPEVTVLQREHLVVDDLQFVGLHSFRPFGRVGTRNRLTDGFEVALVAPLAPDVVVLQQEGTDVAIAAEEPEELGRDELERNLLGGNQRKAFPQIVPNRDAGKASRSGTGTVALVDAVVIHVTKCFFVRNQPWHRYSQ